MMMIIILKKPSHRPCWPCCARPQGKKATKYQNGFLASFIRVASKDSNSCEVSKNYPNYSANIYGILLDEEEIEALRWVLGKWRGRYQRGLDFVQWRGVGFSTHFTFEAHVFHLQSYRIHLTSFPSLSEAKIQVKTLRKCLPKKLGAVEEEGATGENRWPPYPSKTQAVLRTILLEGPLRTWNLSAFRISKPVCCFPSTEKRLKGMNNDNN